MRPIKTEDDLRWHVSRLAEAHPKFAEIAASVPEIPMRWLDPGFKGLVWVITGQQISVAAGRAIFGRLEAALETVSAETVSRAPDELLREAGYSAGKIRTLRAVQEATLAGDVNFEALHDMDADEAIAALCQIKGIGPWTAEVYLLFAAGHPDIFPAGDVALQEAVRLAFGGDSRLAQKTLRAMTKDWSPWRSAAARLLWSYYRIQKLGRQGIIV
jgi:DNA-3-methyladenine glycosylase II